jgi:predicted Rossmann-fold nucleotide-binding protein
MLKIISGGQTGVDRAALDVALTLRIPFGGFCPKGRKSEDGAIPEKYLLIETKSDNYPERTELNVKTGDGTLILIAGDFDRGTQLTIELCKRHNKPCLVIDLNDEKDPVDLKLWIEKNDISVLNIAGNRESISPGIHKKAYQFLLTEFFATDYTDGHR